MNTLFRLENVVVRYAGTEVLRVEALDIPEHSVFGLAGHNGSGKSTLLRLLALLERPASGRLLVDGADSAGRERELRRRVTLLDQEPYLLRRSVLENVAYGLRARRESGDLERPRGWPWPPASSSAPGPCFWTSPRPIWTPRA